jgi:GTP-binding protein
MPQTRFVLKKSLELGLRPIVVINKIDKPAADPRHAESEVLELFLELGATDEQANFPVVYAIGRSGLAKRKLTDESTDLTPLLDTILEHVKPAPANGEEPLRFQPFNLGYDNFLGRLAVGRIYSGTLKAGANVFVKKPNGETRAGKLTKLFLFKGLEKVEAEEAGAGDIALLAGLSDIYIGETVTTDENVPPLPAIAVDEPTIKLSFYVNNSPFAGREGKFVTTRQLRDYLERELEVNVGLKVDFSSPEVFRVYGRGEFQIAILLENMRRAGYEVQVSQPEALTREENGQILEPFEEVVIDLPAEFQGVIIERLGLRAVHLKHVTTRGDQARLLFEGPTRGLLGYRNQFVVDTKGEGIMSTHFVGYKPYAGEVRRRQVGSMISMAAGKALGYSLWGLQERGQLYIGPQTEVYEGMVIGNTSKGEEMRVNPTKGKALSNVRASGTDEAIDLVPPLTLTIERGLEIMASDEYLEVTPKNVRLRKQPL